MQVIWKILKVRLSWWQRAVWTALCVCKKCLFESALAGVGNQFLHTWGHGELRGKLLEAQIWTQGICTWDIGNRLNERFAVWVLMLLGRHFIIPSQEQMEVTQRQAETCRTDHPGEWNGRWSLKSIYGWLLYVKQIWSRTESWRSVPQAHVQPIVSLDSFQVALAWKQMSNPSNIPLPIHSDNLLLKKMGLINLPIDSGEQVKNTFFNFDNTISIIKRTSLYVQRLCWPHVVFISDVLQASQRQYEYQMEKASWTLNSMSSRIFFSPG